jgi:chromosome segregation ATPase
LLDQQIICPKIIDGLERKIDSMTKKILTLETQCGDIDSELRTHGSKIDNMHCNTRTSHSHSYNSNSSKLVEAIEDLTKIVRKNDKKMEELETKISNANSKMKKIIKYLNLE